MLPFVFAFLLLFPLFPALPCLWEPKAADNVDAQHGKPQNSTRHSQFRAAALGATGFQSSFSRGWEGGLFVLPASAICFSCFNDRIAKETGLPHGTVASFIYSLFLFMLLLCLLFISLRENDVNSVRSVCSSRGFNALPVPARAEKSRPRRYR